ncbi:hypothetical protein IFM89_000600 [Coptis chinensis]|uniref:Aminotransferase-like plant mobile domain-containing protein n=1 Tax=Coptis chinensis TaxID=261450 RepID=A0A835HBZ5_9MAGN|nr:hypothetical protein IFM89_000600 [Coptis chinensis]
MKARLKKGNWDRDCMICKHPFCVVKWIVVCGDIRKTELCHSCSELKNVCEVCGQDLAPVKKEVFIANLPRMVVKKTCKKSKAISAYDTSYKGISSMDKYRTNDLFHRIYETFETAQQLFPGKEFKDDDPAKALRLTLSNWTGNGIQCRWFEDRYVNYILEKPKGWDPGADHEYEYILAFLFYMVGQAFLKTGTSSIRLSLVMDLLDRLVMKDIDFGGAIYAYLFRGMDEVVRTKSSKGQILGFSIILQYWWFEYAHTLNPIQDPLYNGDEVPKIKAWGKNKVEKHYGTDTLRSMYALSLRLTHGMRRVLLDTSRQSFKDLEAERTRGNIAEHELEDIRLHFGQAYMDS